MPNFDRDDLTNEGCGFKITNNIVVNYFRLLACHLELNAMEDGPQGRVRHFNQYELLSLVTFSPCSSTLTALRHYSPGPSGH